MRSHRKTTKNNTQKENFKPISYKTVKKKKKRGGLKKYAG